MEPTRAQRVEGAGVAAAALGALWWLDAGLLTIGVFALAPDISMLGYLRNPRVGAAIYNVVHVYLGPLALGAMGLWLSRDLAVVIAVTWIAHIGVDRAVGYGLKFPDAFDHTHLDGADRSKLT
jgi:hypothetical protein